MRNVAFVAFVAFLGLWFSVVFVVACSVTPPRKPTIHMFYDNSTFCCIERSGHLLDCGALKIRNASNYINTEKECTQ